MSTSSSEYDGPERRRTRIHPWRWRGLILWIVVFSLLTFIAIRGVENQSAKVASLQRTNCGLVNFLLTARRARWDTYQTNHKASDLEAVIGYEKLALPFLNGTDRHEAIGHCVIAKRLIIRQRRLDHLSR